MWTTYEEFASYLNLQNSQRETFQCHAPELAQRVLMWDTLHSAGKYRDRTDAYWMQAIAAPPGLKHGTKRRWLRSHVYFVPVDYKASDAMPMTSDGRHLALACTGILPKYDTTRLQLVPTRLLTGSSDELQETLRACGVRIGVPEASASPHDPGMQTRKGKVGKGKTVS